MYQEIQDKAAEFLRTYNPAGLVPFPFEAAAQAIGEVEIVPLETVDSHVSGAIFCQDDKFKIIINPKKAKVRQYFTLAHEFGHYYLHKDWLEQNKNSGFVDFSTMLDADSTLFRPDTPPLGKEEIRREREANNFAAEILMPADKVEEFWDVSPDIVKCSEAFQVSLSAMAIRLERLGLLA